MRLQGHALGQQRLHIAEMGTEVCADHSERWPQQAAFTLKRVPGTAGNVALPSGYSHINQDCLQELECAC